MTHSRFMAEVTANALSTFSYADGDEMSVWAFDRAMKEKV